MTISATTEDLSKVVLDMNAEVNLTWADTDVITVYDGSAANPFTITYLILFRSSNCERAFCALFIRANL